MEYIVFPNWLLEPESGFTLPGKRHWWAESGPASRLGDLHTSQFKEVSFTFFLYWWLSFSPQSIQATLSCNIFCEISKLLNMSSYCNSLCYWFWTWTEHFWFFRPLMQDLYISCRSAADSYSKPHVCHLLEINTWISYMLFCSLIRIVFIAYLC